jgi:hypothetical protein
MKYSINFSLIGLVTISACLFLLGCRSGAPELVEFCRQFDENASIYQAYPIEQRYDLYLRVDDEPTCDADSQGMSSYLVWNLLEDEKTTEFLIEKLKSETDERHQQYIIQALRQASTKGRLKGRRDVVELAYQKAKSMRGDPMDRVFGSKPLIDNALHDAAVIDANSN